MPRYKGSWSRLEHVTVPRIVVFVFEKERTVGTRRFPPTDFLLRISSYGVLSAGAEPCKSSISRGGRRPVVTPLCPCSGINSNSYLPQEIYYMIQIDLSGIRDAVLQQKGHHLIKNGRGQWTGTGDWSKNLQRICLSRSLCLLCWLAGYHWEPISLQTVATWAKSAGMGGLGPDLTLSAQLPSASRPSTCRCGLGENRSEGGPKVASCEFAGRGWIFTR